MSASVCSLVEWSQEVKRRSPSRLLALLPVLVIRRELSGAPETPTAVGHTRAPAAISLSPLLMELPRELVMDVLCLLFSKLPNTLASFPPRGWNNTSGCDERLSRIRTREDRVGGGSDLRNTPSASRFLSGSEVIPPSADEGAGPGLRTLIAAGHILVTQTNFPSPPSGVFLKGVSGLQSPGPTVWRPRESRSA